MRAPSSCLPRASPPRLESQRRALHHCHRATPALTLPRSVPTLLHRARSSVVPHAVQSVRPPKSTRTRRITGASSGADTFLSDTLDKGQYCTYSIAPRFSSCPDERKTAPATGLSSGCCWCCGCCRRRRCCRIARDVQHGQVRRPHAGHFRVRPDLRAGQ